MAPKQVLLHRIRVALGVIAMVESKLFHFYINKPYFVYNLYKKANKQFNFY